jgi:deazaflavin-dependent oxidoreductase (nitroreductase family)
MVPLWRLGLARLMNVWPHGFGRILVIEHVGRKSGRPYRTPVNYTHAGDDLHCVAGFGTRTDWYRNITAVSEIAVWLPDGRWVATAEDISDDPRRVDLIRAVLIDTGFAAYLAGINPRRIDDQAMAVRTADYRLVRIRPARKQHASGGPGDLAWTWMPIAVVVWLFRRRRRHAGA